MSKYIMRLDDAAIKMDLEKWNEMERLLDKYEIKPLVGVIPNCKDPMMDKYNENPLFWDLVKKWVKKDWVIALHGYEHVYCSDNGGLNPINNRSEFAGVSYEDQCMKLRKGIEIFKEHNINPKVFFAPSHTFDLHTLKALLEVSDIKVISDTLANEPYSKYGITFVPQQAGRVRNLPFKITTFCYHPNTMTTKDFQFLDAYFKVYSGKFIGFPTNQVTRRYSLNDLCINKIYFMRRKLRSLK